VSPRRTVNFKRSDRVSELLRHEISRLVLEIKDPRLGFVTITGVQVSDDLTDAKVYFSVFGSPEERRVNSQILVHSVPSIRHALGRKLESLYRPPALNFIYDETPERAQRVFSILNQLSKDEGKESPGVGVSQKQSLAARKISSRKRKKRN
jgi:ribosome-binding factor A